MLQQFNEHLPFPSRISPDVEGATRRQLPRARAQGLLLSEEGEKRFLGWRLAELGARFHPQATGDDLDVGVAQLDFFFLFDDQFDGPDGQCPPKAIALARELVDFVQRLPGGKPKTSSPLAHAFADMWQHSTKGMSPDWCGRAARDWVMYFNGCIAEAEERRHGNYIDFDAYMKFRETSIGVAPVVNLAERLGHRGEVPPRIMESSILQQMLSITKFVVILDNDLDSLAKEAPRGDKYNAVLSLQYCHEYSRHDAIVIIRDKLRQHIKRFINLEAELPSLFDSLAATPSEREGTEAYITDGMCNCMRANHDWGKISDRYAAEAVVPLGAPQYVDVLV